MSSRLLISGIVLVLIVIAFAAPQLAGTLFLNLANTQIARAVSLPSDASSRAALLAESDLNLKQARSFSNSPRVVLATARNALARNDASRALDAFNSSGILLDDDSVAQFTWAEAAWQVNEKDIAFAHWRSAKALEYFRQQMYRAQYFHRILDAERYARIAVGIDPNFAEAHLILGDALSQQNINDPEAMQELDRAFGLTRDKELISTILARKGEILVSQHKLRDAIEVFSEARRIAPIDARPRTDYAMTSLQLDPGARDSSIALLKEVVGDSPWYIAAYIALANIYEPSGQVGDAQSWLESGLRKNPNDPSLLFELGQFYSRQHRVTEARATLILALKYETRADSLQAIQRALIELPPQ